MSYRPHLLTKVRSEVLMQSIGGKGVDLNIDGPMHCTLRLAGLVGLRCADRSTVVGCHQGNLGKGTSTKTSDLSVVAGCLVCHMLQERLLTGWKLLHLDPEMRALMYERILAATHETHSVLAGQGIIRVKGATLI